MFPRSGSTRIYNANLVKASLKVPESRIIAGLLLRDLDADAWHRQVVVENVLQKSSPFTAQTFANYIGARLRTLDPAAWRLIQEGSNGASTQMVLAAAIRHSRLLSDFLELLVSDRYGHFGKSITVRDWTEFIDDCKVRDPGVESWTGGVVAKLRQNTFRIAAEAGYVTNTKSMNLQRVEIYPEVEEALRRMNYLDTLRAMMATN